MSASEKLKALAPSDLPLTASAELLHVFPQIVAVVEAAEQGERYTNRDLERPFGGNRNSWMETETLDAALTALGEALS